MPEASEFKLWTTRKWSNLHARSGTRLVRRPYYYKISEDKTKILRDLGFELKLSGSNQYVYIDKTRLLDVAKKLGIDDDALKQMTP